MSFTSPVYFAFLTITLIIYFNVPMRWRGYFLLFSSYIFYTSYNPKYIIFILATTLASFFGAKIIMQTSRKKVKCFALSTALFVMLSMLGFTKYWNTIAESTHLFTTLDILIPLGISFYTFQSIGYLIDVYREEVRAEENLGRYALFVSFFPHLLAGPIESSHNFLPQTYEEKNYDYKKVSFGIMLIAIGLFKKLFVADRLKPIVNLIFNSPGEQYGLSVALGALMARFQIYFDFSGYTDIAIGSALMFGYQLSVNFNRPFFSNSISEYWQRWHITLTNWIKSYIFYPMITSSFRIFGIGVITITTFLILGLWHGLTINYILYGLIQGILVLIDLKTKSNRQNFYRKTGLILFPRLLSTITVFITFFILVVPPTILFRSESFVITQTLITNLFAKSWSLVDLAPILEAKHLLYSLVIAGLGILVTESIDWIQKKKIRIDEYIWNKSIFLFYALIFIILFLALTYGEIGVNSSFIYTQY